eukprot:366333-Chlamydomonas_euryale.AAC.9
MPVVVLQRPLSCCDARCRAATALIPRLTIHLGSRRIGTSPSTHTAAMFCDLTGHHNESSWSLHRVTTAEQLFSINDVSGRLRHQAYRCVSTWPSGPGQS